MRMTIIALGGRVVIDGIAQEGIDMSTMPVGASVVQWYADHGEIEFTEVLHEGQYVKPPNQLITTVAQFDSIIAAHAAATAAANQPAPGPTLAAVKAEKREEINTASSNSAAQLLANYPDFETKTWPDQKAEAMAWDAAGGDIPGNTTPTPYIDALAGYRAITRVQYLQKTVVKVNTFDKNAQYLVGTRQKYIDQVDTILVDVNTTEAQAIAQVRAITPVFTLIP